jgi:hypothetical protein
VQRRGVEIRRKAGTLTRHLLSIGKAGSGVYRG